MKTVIKDKELKEVIINATDMICDATSSTLGPKGNNVIINTDASSPYITNDGVTIAKAIESDEPAINTVLEIIKEASLKTNEEAGDGTTTTLTLLKGIMHYGLEEIDKGVNAYTLKNELEKALEKAINRIKNESEKPTDEDLLNIAIVSANDEEIGSFVYNVFKEMGSKNSINLKESNNQSTYYELSSGYPLELDDIPSLYFDKAKEITIDNVNILLLRGYLSSLEEISEIINDSIINNKPILIMASDYEETIRNEIITYYLKEKLNIFLFKLPDYASRKEIILKDLESLSNAKIINLNIDYPSNNSVGKVKGININKDKLVIISDNDISDRVKELEEEIASTDSDYDKEFLRTRLSYLTKGIATIYVGDNTKIEKREKIMRYEDALCALDSSSEGVTLGEGLTYLKISDTLGSTTGESVIKKALLIPFKTIMNNAGLNSNELLNSIMDNNYKLAYDFNENKLIDIKDFKTKDPLKVSIEALTNAVSISSLLLTTNYLVIKESIKDNKYDLNL